MQVCVWEFFLFIFLHVLLWYCRHWSKIQFKMIYWNWWWSTKTKENGEEMSRETVKTNGNEEIAAGEWQRNSWASDYVCFCVLPDCYFIFCPYFSLSRSPFIRCIESQELNECSIKYHKFITVCSTPISALPELTSLAKTRNFHTRNALHNGVLEWNLCSGQFYCW